MEWSGVDEWVGVYFLLRGILCGLMIYFTGVALGWMDGWNWFADLIAMACFFLFCLLSFCCTGEAYLPDELIIMDA